MCRTELIGIESLSLYCVYILNHDSLKLCKYHSTTKVLFATSSLAFLYDKTTHGQHFCCLGCISTAALLSILAIRYLTLPFTVIYYTGR